jgi:colanic acid biosynthesis glycosyl transferase WcaI
MNLDDSREAARPRVVVHDFAGHPFQIQLSRELARRGYRIDHQYSPTNVTGHGDMQLRPDDPPGLSITRVNLRRTFARYRPVLRLVQEIEYALKADRAIRRFRPDLVLLCNMSLLSNLLLIDLLRLRRTRYVFWHQDVYSHGVRATADRLFPRRVAAMVGAVAEIAEKSVVTNARHVVAIADAFTDVYERWNVDEGRYTVIPNWAVLDDLPVVQPDRLSAGEGGRHRLLYAGTLGLKHDPKLLLALAAAPQLDDTTVVVVSEGKGRDWLERRAGEVPAGRLELRDYVPFAEMPMLLGSADVLLCVLEPAASRFSVPSKVLTYLCAGRPVVAVMDPANVVAAMLRTHDAGVVVAHADAATLPGVLRSLLDDESRRTLLGRRARQLAEDAFDLAAVADRSEAVLEQALSRDPVGRGVRRRHIWVYGVRNTADLLHFRR